MDKDQKTSKILDALKNQGVTRGGLQAAVGVAAGHGHVDVKDALPAMRALLVIMTMIEGK